MDINFFEFPPDFRENFFKIELFWTILLRGFPEIADYPHMSVV